MVLGKLFVPNLVAQITQLFTMMCRESRSKTLELEVKVFGEFKAILFPRLARLVSEASICVPTNQYDTQQQVLYVEHLWDFLSNILKSVGL